MRLATLCCHHASAHDVGRPVNRVGRKHGAAARYSANIIPCCCGRLMNILGGSVLAQHTGMPVLITCCLGTPPSRKPLV
jgi:hypothetical protein